MIAVVTSSSFSYEIHSLTQAFYPGEEIKVVSDCSAVPEGAEPLLLPDLPEEKDACKRELYRFLSEHTLKILPWGTLTGIRPTRIALNLMLAGKEEPEIAAHFKENFFVSEEKTALAIAIAKREAKILQTIDYANGFSLYVGIPFCPTTCAYCSFTSYPLQKHVHLTDTYLDALCKEISFVKEAFRDRPMHTVYIGGGTPTTLTPEQMERLLSFLREQLDFTHTLEVTVESGRPDSMSKEVLQVMKNAGVTRISVNPQTFNEETLRRIGRGHTVEETKAAFSLAREVGFTDINMDIILGLPGETPDDVRFTMEELCKLNPEDITVHSLALKRGSFFHRMQVEGGKIERADAPEEMMRIAVTKAASIDCTPYYLYRQKNMTGNLENTGLAKEGKEGLYNILINEEVQSIAAVGLGAISKRVYPEGGRIERSENRKDLPLYLDGIDEMIERKRALFCG